MQKRRLFLTLGCYKPIPAVSLFWSKKLQERLEGTNVRALPRLLVKGSLELFTEFSRINKSDEVVTFCDRKATDCNNKEERLRKKIREQASAAARVAEPFPLHHSYMILLPAE